MKSLNTRKPFVAIDGEGITTGLHHYYNLITARSSDLDKTIVVPSTTHRLTTWEIFTFLRRRCASFRQAKGIFIMFSFDYDITKWLEDLTHEELEELYLTTKVKVTSPDGIDYVISYFRRKFFTIQFIYKDVNGKFKTSAVTIYDVFSFFGTSFVRALEQWGFEIPDFLRDMKEQRGDFNKVDKQTIINYNALECELLCQLMNKVRDALNAENIPLSKWHGSGAVAQKLLEIQNAKPQIAIPQITNSGDMYEAIMGSYFGGRFELFRKGIIPHTHQYDINSAYPYAMATLPDLSQCTIDYSERYTNDPFSIWFITYNVLKHEGRNANRFSYQSAKTNLAGPFPYRTQQGNILYPYHNSYGVWIHQCELQTAINIYGQSSFQIHYGYIITPYSQKAAFPFIPELAAKRLALKENGDLRNIVLKLALNSLYGKTAQGQRQVGIIPPFQNYYIAGYVTAYTRAKLLGKSYSCGNAGSGIIQFATDGIFSMVANSTIKHSSNDFGGWEYTNIPVPICYIQGGIYYSEQKAKTNKRRTRGFNANALEAEDVFNAWKQFYYSSGHSPQSISASENRFFGIGTTIATKNWGRYGRFVNTKRELSFFTPSKQFANPGGELFSGYDEWKFMAPRINGLSENEFRRNGREYTLMIPNPDLVEGVSKLYTPVNLKDMSNIPDDILYMIIDSIQSGEQPDYYENEILELEV